MGCHKKDPLSKSHRDQIIIQVKKRSSLAQRQSHSIVIITKFGVSRLNLKVGRSTRHRGLFYPKYISLKSIQSLRGQEFLSMFISHKKTSTEVGGWSKGAKLCPRGYWMAPTLISCLEKLGVQKRQIIIFLH